MRWAPGPMWPGLILILTIMNNDELRRKYKKILQDRPVKARKVLQCNFDPHPFCIGPQHMKGAGMIIGKTEMRSAPCAAPGCELNYDQHTSQKVLLVQLTEHMKKAAFDKIVSDLKESFKKDGIEGLALVETDEKFRVT